MYYDKYMPTKHVVKSFDAPAYYHIYNRASGERPLFRDTLDRQYFLRLLQQHLHETPYDDDDKDKIKTYDVQVVAYCLMGNHFHLLLFQQYDPDAMTGYMRSVGTKYSMYYNRKYNSKGHVFQSSYRASRITDESYLAHITRYIHLNPRNWRTTRWSSYQDYVGERRTDWVHPEYVLTHSPRQYAAFVQDYATTDLRAAYNQLEDYLAS